MAQLQDTQSQLADLSSQLEQKGQASGPANPMAILGSGIQPPASGENIPALLAEIEQLYQFMQPLMVQLDVATQVGRPANELEAMRAQMASIHQRLDALLDRVEAAKAVANAAANASAISGIGATATPWVAPAGVTVSPDQVTYEQLLQNMLQAQSLLQQMQRQLQQTQNAGTVPYSPAAPSVNPMPGMGDH
jgi:hypothetical protein